MTDKPRFPWLKLAGAIVGNLPSVKQALATTVNGLERNPELLKLVEGIQDVNQKDCLICLAHRIAKDKGVAASPEPPDHWCPTRKGPSGARVCGCGRPATRRASHGQSVDLEVCEEYPGCLPAQKVRSKR